MQVSDAQILSTFKNHTTREKGFNMLVVKYQEPLYWQVRRMVIHHDDANDVTQNVLIKVWKYLDNFKGDAQLHTWLFRIAYNESLTYINQQKKKRAVGLDNEENGVEQQLVADEYFSGDEIQRKLQAAIVSLPEKQRAVFNLRYYEEMPYEQMSEVLETSVGALKASYHHAVKKIEKFVTRD